MDSSISFLSHDRRCATWWSIAAALSVMLGGGLLAWRRFHIPATVADAGVFAVCVLGLWWIVRLLQRIDGPDQARAVK